MVLFEAVTFLAAALRGSRHSSRNQKQEPATKSDCETSWLVYSNTEIGL